MSHGVWTAPATIAEGGNIFANWAGVRYVAKQDERTAFAHWAEISARPMEASWKPLGNRTPCDDDRTPLPVARARGQRTARAVGRAMAGVPTER